MPMAGRIRGGDGSGAHRAMLVALVALILGGGAAWTIACARPPYHFAAVQAGVLYRSGQLGARDLVRVKAAAGIRTIIDLCSEKRCTNEALEERAFARESGVRLVHLPTPEGMTGGLDEYLPQLFAVLDDPRNHPVLIHCWKGIKRTGVIVSIFKMEYLRMDGAQALRELPAFGRTLEEFLPAQRAAVEGYVPRWKRAAPPSTSAPAKR